jgi:hypothetical protein
MAGVSQEFLVRVLPRAVVAVVAMVALLPALLTAVGDADTAEGLGGDFPSFYGAGRVVLDGDGDSLYDPLTQRQAQQELHNDADEFLYFAYPPFVAVGYAAIAWLPYGVALSVHSLAALAALIWAVWIVVPHISERYSRADHVFVGTAVALAAYPVITAVLGGQNTTFTLLLAALVWRNVIDGNLMLAGVAGTLALYKPQFGLLLALAMVITRKWVTVAFIALGAVVVYALAAVGWGLNWATTWFDQVQRFGDVNDAVNGPLMINIIGWFTNLSDSTASFVAAGVLIVVVFLVTAVLLWRRGVSWETFGPMASWVLLVAPSALFYDFGFALVGFGATVGREARRLWIVGVAVVVSWSQLAAWTLGWSPLFLVLMIMWVYQVRDMTGDHGAGSPDHSVAKAG